MKLGMVQSVEIPTSSAARNLLTAPVTTGLFPSDETPMSWAIFGQQSGDDERPPPPTQLKPLKHVVSVS